MSIFKIAELATQISAALHAIVQTMPITRDPVPPMPEGQTATRHLSERDASDHLLSSARVLMVDDDAAALLMMGEALRQRGFAVAEAENGAIARDACREFQPDLILLDIDMPEMDGFTACAAIRAESEPSLPIVMVTGLSDADSIHRAFAAGATDFITKPINWPLFHHRVETILASARTAQGLVASDKKLHYLERLAPDIALLVTKKGVILQQLGREVLESLAGNPGALEMIWPEDIALAMRQHISGVLKTRQILKQDFELSIGGDVYSYEADFLPDGRDRVLMMVRRVVGDGQRDKVYRLAYYEDDTALPNLHLLENRLDACLARATLQERRAAVLCISFDQLRATSRETDSNRRVALLRSVAEALNAAVNELESIVALDDNQACVARISSHQFGMLLLDIRSRDDVIAAATRIEQAMETPLQVGEQAYRLLPAIGMSLFPDHGRDVGALISAAKLAVENTDTSSRYRFYAESAQVSTLSRLDFASELRWALDKEQLQLHYQPRLDLTSGRVISVEALLRWYHPLRGVVPLAELLPLAEATGMIVPIGEWVLATACREIGGLSMPLRVAVNLSPYEFAADGLAARLSAILEQAGIAPDALELELTEAALRRLPDPRTALQKLDELGVHVLLDDFGAGVSSLATLKGFRISGLKISAAFVRGLQANSEDWAMCKVIITMAHTLGLTAIAQGVETAEQLHRLRDLGCNELQGFLFSYPMPLEELQAYLDEKARAAADAKPT